MSLAVGCLFVVVLVAGGTLFGGWVLMLLCGALWHEFGWLAPIGYWPAVGISFCLSVVGSMIFGRTSVTTK